ncbi:MAG: FAD-dependent oxidoreductase [Acidobacteria bacterium]|nr:FAD-dependent oxidoreductase [Acidobacteriota bacterium]
MNTLRRDPSAAAAEAHDLIIVGGGIYGAMTALEAARRGLRPLLLERDDYGGATSWNSHRIVHGGLRYLQRFDLNRFRTSVRERSWFLRHFPDQVEPLACLMPLYGQGVRRPSVLRAALLANHLLSRGRNDDLRSDRRIESGGVMTVLETRSVFPQVREEGLRGGALWYDAVMTDSQRLLIEVLRWASACGARCLNYVEATRLRVEAGGVVGIEATDGVDGATLLFDATIVVNCAGPWSGRVAGAFDRPMEELFRPSLAFNLLFDRAPPSEVAVAVSAPEPGAHTWFLYPRSGRTYAGTAHFPCGKGAETWTPSRQQIDAVIDDMNAAVPGLDLRRHQVMRVYSGLLPATGQGSTELASKPMIYDHGANGGARGLFSVSGVKYTTARDVAEKTLRRAFARLAEIGEGTERPPAREIPAIGAAAKEGTGNDLAEAIRRFADDEGVIHLDDLLLRRGDWGDDPRTLERTGQVVGEMLGWDEVRLDAELDRLAAPADTENSGRHP